MLFMCLSDAVVRVLGATSCLKTSCALGRHNMPPPRPAIEACSGSLEPGQLSWTGPDQPIRTIPAGWPAVRLHMPPADRCKRQTTDVRQHHCLMPPGQGIISSSTVSMFSLVWACVFCKKLSYFLSAEPAASIFCSSLFSAEGDHCLSGYLFDS